MFCEGIFGATHRRLSAAKIFVRSRSSEGERVIVWLDGRGHYAATCHEQSTSFGAVLALKKTRPSSPKTHTKFSFNLFEFLHRRDRTPPRKRGARTNTEGTLSACIRFQTADPTQSTCTKISLCSGPRRLLYKRRRRPEGRVQEAFGLSRQEKRVQGYRDLPIKQKHAVLMLAGPLPEHEMANAHHFFSHPRDLVLQRKRATQKEIHISRHLTYSHPAGLGTMKVVRQAESEKNQCEFISTPAENTRVEIGTLRSAWTRVRSIDPVQGVFLTSAVMTGNEACIAFAGLFFSCSRRCHGNEQARLEGVTPWARSRVFITITDAVTSELNLAQAHWQFVSWLLFKPWPCRCQRLGQELRLSHSQAPDVQIRALPRKSVGRKVTSARLREIFTYLNFIHVQYFRGGAWIQGFTH